MPPIELSALADGISYASSVFFAVLLYRRGMLTCGNLLRTFFAGMCAFIHFIAGPRGYAGLPFFYDWIRYSTKAKISQDVLPYFNTGLWSIYSNPIIEKR